MDVIQVPRLVPGQVWTTDDESASITIIGRAGNGLGWLVRSVDTTATVMAEPVIRADYRLISDDINFHLD